jgi:hypothetical protein
MTAQDLPWALSLAYGRYAPFDPGAGAIFYLNCLKSEVTLKIRRSQAFLIATTVGVPWRPVEREAHVLVLCAAEGHHWQAVGLLRESLRWARSQGCRHWRFSSDTTYPVDALCRRIGAKRETRYSAEL